jgi:hypothetical protein
VLVDGSLQVALSISSILFGFLFTGFWWILNRELKFEPEGRHFKLGTLLLVISIVLLGMFGIGLPLRAMAKANPAFVPIYRGIVLTLVILFGYMLTEMGHYSVFQHPKYTKTAEWVCFFATILVVIGLAARWLLF